MKKSDFSEQCFNIQTVLLKDNRCINGNQFVLITDNMQGGFFDENN